MSETSPKSSTLALFMMAGAGSGGAISTWGTIQKARGDVLESYVSIEADAEGEKLRRFLEVILDALEGSSDIIYLSMAFAAFLALPVAFIAHHIEHQPHTCRHRCPTHSP